MTKNYGKARWASPSTHDFCDSNNLPEEQDKALLGTGKYQIKSISIQTNTDSLEKVYGDENNDNIGN